MSQPAQGGGEAAPGAPFEYSGTTESEDSTALAVNSDVHPGADAPGTSPAMAQGPTPQAEENPGVHQPAIRQNDWVVLGKFVFHVDGLNGTKMWVMKLGGNKVKKDIMQVVWDNLGVIQNPLGARATEWARR